MAKAKHFNKGLLKGTVVKSDLIDYENKNKQKDKFLSIEVMTGKNNKVKATVFPTKSNPQKAKELHAQYPVNSLVEVSGSVQEKEYEPKNGGKKGIDRSVSLMSIRALGEDVKPNATFIIQGNVAKVQQIDGGAKIFVEVDSSFTDKDEKKVERWDKFTLICRVDDLVDDVDLKKGCNAKFKGLIINRLEFDDYGDVTGQEQEFKVEKIEDVIQKGDIEEGEEVGFI